MILQDKVAFITGGARGMGRAIALRYADEGCNSVIVDVLDKEGEQTVGDIKAKGRDAIYLHCDVSNSAQVKETVEKAIEKFGKIDILNNCAGVGTNPTPFEATTEEEWDRVMNINCKGTFLTIFYIAPYMKKQNSGKIINIVSVAAFETGAMNVHYHASKAAQASVSRSAAADLAPYNVCVNMIHPGMVLTDMSAVFSGPGVTDVEAHQRGMAQNMVPLKRMGMPEDIAKAALFLASPESDYITGDSICVSGGSGLLMKTP
ncbi:MAG TPA: SDR family oxidoreductase [Dehalococcoidia bacterium]|nr:SDR family oxidoreductase [Dehalococcoidia bacterium]